MLCVLWCVCAALAYCELLPILNPVQKAVSIVEAYFGGDDVDDATAPAVDANTFAFGVADNASGSAFQF